MSRQRAAVFLAFKTTLHSSETPCPLSKSSVLRVAQPVKQVMEIIKGIGVSSGVVIYPAFLVSDDEIRIGKRSINPSESAAEQKRLQAAIGAGSDDIRELRDTTTRNLGKETGAIFYFHLGLLNDPELLKAFIEGIDRQHYTAGKPRHGS